VASNLDAPAYGSMESLIEALKHDDANIRWEAARALGVSRDARAVEPLLRALGDPDPDVRRKAALALAKIRDRRAVAALRECSENDENQVVRWAAAWGLGRFQERKTA
jgi:HEAT repeat protein